MQQPAARSRTHLAPVAQHLLVALLWSTSWVLIKIGLEDLSPLTFAGLRYVMAAAVLALLWAMRPANRAELRGLPARIWAELTLLGVTFYALAQGGQFAALSRLPAVTTSLILAFIPAFVVLLSIPVLGERARPLQWLGIGVFVAGATVYLRPVDAGWPDPLGLVLALLCMASSAVGTIVGRRVNRDSGLSPMTVTTVTMSIGSLLLLGAGFGIEGMPSVAPSAWLIIAWLAVVNTAFAFVLYNHSLRGLTATESSVLINTMLIQIAALAWIFLDERLTLLDLAGLVLAALGILTVQLSRRPADHVPPVDELTPDSTDTLIRR